MIDTKIETKQVIEDGIVVECDHAGHYQDTIYFNEGLEDEYGRLVEVCDLCPAWSYDGEDWNV